MSAINAIPAKRGRKTLPIEAVFDLADGTSRIRRFSTEFARDLEKEKLRISGQLADGVPWHSFDEVARKVSGPETAKLPPVPPGSRKLLEGPCGREIRVELLPRFTGMSVRALTSDAIDAMRSEIIAARGKGPWTRVSTVVRKIVKEALSRGWIPLADNPYLTLAPSRPTQTALIVRQTKKLEQLPLPTLGQIDSILLNARDWLRPAVHIVLLAGLRTGELRALLWKHVTFDLVNRIVWIGVEVAYKIDGTIGPPKSDAGERDICVSGILFDLLLECHPGKEGEEQPVVSIDGLPLGVLDFYEALQQFQVSIGIGRTIPGKGRTLYRGTFGPHLLRHAAVALWIWSRVPDGVIRYWVGHENLVLTLGIYGYIFDAKDRGLDTWPTGSVPTGEEVDEGATIQ